MRQIQELRPNLFTLDVALSGYDVRSVVVIGEKHAAVWDTLTGPDDMAAVNDVLGSRPFHVIYSHADWDHIWGTTGFARSPLDIIGHTECLRRFDDDVPETLCQMQTGEPGKWDDVSLVAPNIAFKSRLSLDLGGVTLDLQTLPGHTADCIVGWLPEWGILLGGDAIETPLPVVYDATLVPGWLQALEGWAGNNALVRSIPAHGSVKGRESLDMTIDYLRRLTTGDTFQLTPDLDLFYHHTHQQNLELMRGGASPDE